MKDDSLTPETDAEETKFDCSIIPRERHYCVEADFARQLELSRNEWRKLCCFIASRFEEKVKLHPAFPSDYELLTRFRELKKEANQNED